MIHPLPPRLSASLDVVWAATYAAAFLAQASDEARCTGITAPDDADADRIAEDAATMADIATGALARLRTREWGNQAPGHVEQPADAHAAVKEAIDGR